MSFEAPAPLFIDELERELALPGALERWSLLTGEPCLVVDLRSANANPRSGADATRTREIARRLWMLPALTVALVDRGASGVSDLRAVAGASGGAAVDELATACDLHLAAPRELEAVADTLAHTPLASLALVQLLRLGVGRTLHEALIAESLVYSMLQSGPEFARWLRERERKAPRPEPDEPAVRVEREEERLRLAFNRPAKRNAFSARMRDELCEALQVAQADPGLQVELSGRGKAFCAGGDLDEFGTLPDPATAHAIRSTRSAGRLLSELAERTTALVHGACVGAGVELAAFAGRVAALDDAFFQLPELSLGLVPGAGGTASLPRRIGRQRTVWLALSGERIDVTTALDWGLIDELAIT